MSDASAAALIAGTTVGAGVLALPAATAGAGFAASTGVLCGSWVFMAAAGLLVHRLLEERRSAIGRWLVEVKGGRSATDAWQEVFGESLVETAQRPLAFWRIND